MTMDEDTEYEVQQWCEAIARLHEHEVHDDIARTAGHEMAMLWSASGFQDAPTAVLRMVVQAMEIGYARAIYDVQDGNFDDYLPRWRPHLTEG
jgi:hypothetical protein